jgi:ATP synthase protein I
LLKTASVGTMSDARENGDRGKQQTDEAALSARLQRLGERLSREQSEQPIEPTPVSGGRSSAMAGGLRLSSELIGGVIGGAVIGWLFDYGLGTAPWGLIVFVLLGFAAGLLSLMRTAGFVLGGAPRQDD